MDTKAWLSGAASLQCTAFKSRLLDESSCLSVLLMEFMES